MQFLLGAEAAAAIAIEVAPRRATRRSLGKLPLVWACVRQDYQARKRRVVTVDNWIIRRRSKYALCGLTRRPQRRASLEKDHIALWPRVSAGWWQQETCACRDHGRAACVDGLDDLVGVDPLEVNRRHAEVAVAELALNDVERHVLAKQLRGLYAK